MLLSVLRPALLGVGCFFSLAVASPAEIWIDVTSPAADGRHDGPLPFAEVQGYAWTGASPLLDVVIAIDLSRSTLVASGSDVNGNGRVGRLRPEGRRLFLPLSAERYDPRLLASDVGDSVANAELAAARRFAQSIDPERTRMALLSFGESAEVHVELTSDVDLVLAAVDRLVRLERRRARDFGGGGSNMGLALATAGRLLLEADAARLHPRREVLMLSDGLPSRPHRRGPKFLAAAALVLAERDVRLHLVPIGAFAARNAEYFAFLDELTGGSHTKITSLGEVVERLPQVRLDPGTQLSIRNRTTGRTARSLRVFADGTFDAVVALAPGENELEFEAREAGGRARVVRRLRFEVDTPETAAEARRQREAVEAFIGRMRLRSAETSLLVELEAAHEAARRQERRLELQRHDTDERREVD